MSHHASSLFLDAAFEGLIIDSHDNFCKGSFYERFGATEGLTHSSICYVLNMNIISSIVKISAPSSASLVLMC